MQGSGTVALVGMADLRLATCVTVQRKCGSEQKAPIAAAMLAELRQVMRVLDEAGDEGGALGAPGAFLQPLLRNDACRFVTGETSARRLNN